MPSGPRVRENNIYGITSDNPLTSVATTMNSAGLVTLPVVSGSHAVLVLDPKRFFGEPEIVVVTSHTAFGTSATIVRGTYGTTARSHPANTPWAHVAVTDDYVKIVTSSTRPADPYEGQIIYETDTNDLLAFNGTIWVSLITIPPGGHVEVVTSTTRPPTPYEGQVIYETDTDEVRVWDGDSWEEISGGGGATILQQDEEPPSPVEDDLWIDTDENAENGGIDIYQQPTEPSSPTTNDLWLDIDESAGTGLSSILAYAEVTTAQNGVTTEVDVTGLTVNISVPSGRRIRITASDQVKSSVANDTARISIFEGATQLQDARISVPVAGTTETIHCEVILSPPAGSHTYKVTIARVAGTGLIDSNPAPTRPAYILVEDITGTLWPAGQSIGAGTIANEAWSTWVPTWGNLTVGSGTVVARYIKLGRTVHFYLRLILSGTTVGTDVTFSLPVPRAIDYSTVAPIGVADYLDSGTVDVQGLVWPSTSSTGRLIVYGTAGAFPSSAVITATVPFTWANNDEINVVGTYEAAS